MRECPRCHTTAEPEARFCTTCGGDLQDHAAGASPPPRQQQRPSLGKGFADDRVRRRIVAPATRSAIDPLTLAPGEVVIRTFDLGTVYRPWGWLTSAISVTDARVVYRAYAKNWMNESLTSREIQITDVSGLALQTRRGLQLINLLVILAGGAVGLFLVTLIAAGSSVTNYYTGDSGPADWVFLLYFFGFVIFVLLLWIRARATTVGLVIFARSVEKSPIALSGSARTGSMGFFTLLVAFVASPLLVVGRRLGILDASEATDSADTDLTRSVYEELGPLILDIQARGTLAGGRGGA